MSKNARENPIEYKYIHLFPFNENRFYENLILMFMEPENGFNISEHLFVTPHQSVFNELRKYGCVEFFSCKSKKEKYLEMIRAYAPKGRWLFMHAICSPKQLLQVPNRILRKTIWRTWGGADTQLRYESNLIRNAFKQFVIKPLWIRKIKRFKAFGGTPLYDKIELSDLLKDKSLKVFKLEYPCKNERFEFSMTSLDDNNKFRVMVGHSATTHDKHIEIISLLEKWKNRDIELYFPLSYNGYREYVEQVKLHAKKKFGEKAIFLENVLPKDEYNKLFSTMDAIILADEHSGSAGHVRLALEYHKKIFVKKNGVIQRALDSIAMPNYSIDMINNMTFDEFKSPPNYLEGMNAHLFLTTYDEAVKAWKECYIWLDSQNDNALSNF